MAKVFTGGITRRRFLKLGALSAGAVALAACGGAGQAQPAASATEPLPSSPSSVPTEPSLPSPSPVPTDPPGSNYVHLEVDTPTGANDFWYAQKTLEAPAGSKIKLQFVNKTNMNDEVGHDWVLVKPGQEASVLANAAKAGDSLDYLQEDDPGVIAHTRLIEGNDMDTIIFDAPVPGTYTYLCTFPKHYEGGEKGLLTIKS